MYQFGQFVEAMVATNSHMAGDKLGACVIGERTVQYSRHLCSQIFLRLYERSGEIVPFHILIGWTGHGGGGGLFDFRPPIRKSEVIVILRVNTGTQYTCVKLKFGVVWFQEDSA